MQSRMEFGIHILETLHLLVLNDLQNWHLTQTNPNLTAIIKNHHIVKCSHHRNKNCHIFLKMKQGHYQISPHFYDSKSKWKNSRTIAKLKSVKQSHTIYFHTYYSLISQLLFYDLHNSRTLSNEPFFFLRQIRFYRFFFIIVSN